MSAEARQALADAANSVNGVLVKPYYAQVTKPGSGFVRLDVINRDASGFGHLCTWQVAVILPQDQATAEKWIDTHSTDLMQALADKGHVMSAQPVALVFDASSVPAFIINVVREKD